MISELLFATTVLVSPVCNWDQPGTNRFTGDVSSAVHNYRDIPENIRVKLEKKLASKKYDDIVEITKDSIIGNHEYTDLRDMHFGKNHICQRVIRDKWTHPAKERGLVYCEEAHCIIVPTVCGNISRVTRIKNTGSISSSGGPVEGITVVNILIPIISPTGPPPVDTFQSKSAPIIVETRYSGSIYFPPLYFPPFYTDNPGWCCCEPVDIPAVPEPDSLLLIAIGLLAIWYIVHKTVRLR